MKKILIVKLSAIGDVMVTSPFPRLIKEIFPESKIHHLVMSHCRVVTENNPWVDGLIVTKFFPTKNKLKDIILFINLVIKLRKQKFDIAYIFHRNFLFQLLCFLAGIRNIVGFSSSFNFFYKKHLDYKFTINRSEQEADLIRLSGISIRTVDHLDFYNNEFSLSYSIASLLPKNFILCNPGGGNPHAPADNRLWPIDKYAELIKRAPIPFVIVGSGDADFKLACQLNNLLDEISVINLVNKTTFSDVSLILKKAKLYLGNDSSLIFLAAAVGTTNIGLYGPTQSEAASPVGGNHIPVIGHSPCSPCYNPFEGIKGQMYLCQDNKCMQNISVDMVLKKINDLLLT